MILKPILPMNNDPNIVLTDAQIRHKVRRIAFQIYETFVDERDIVVAGIAQNGFVLAQMIASEHQAVSDLEVTLCEVTINKQIPTQPVKTSLTPEEYSGKGLILVDDVLNSGTTLAYAIRHFLDVPLTKFKTAVLVDRNHKKYPVKADFKGISLSTSLQDHVEVVFGRESYARRS